MAALALRLSKYTLSARLMAASYDYYANFDVLVLLALIGGGCSPPLLTPIFYIYYESIYMC